MRTTSSTFYQEYQALVKKVQKQVQRQLRQQQQAKMTHRKREMAQAWVLRQQGYSLRAIAAEVEVSYETVRRYLKQYASQKGFVQ
jgi:DNA-binding NarL/FixJ family response regulator